MKRQETLETALQCVMHDRNKDYKDPEDNFGDIAAFGNAFFGEDLAPLTPWKVAIIGMLIKLARIKSNPYKEDNYVDLAGYSACAAECAENQQNRDGKTVIAKSYIDGGVFAAVEEELSRQ